MNLKHVILGFLVERPMHGYELKRKLSPALPPGRMLNDGVLYPLLRRLEAERLVRKRVERGGRSPDRHVYSPTAAGQREFASWLRSSADEADEVTYDFLLGHPFLAKSLFFDRLDPVEVRAKLLDQRNSSREKLRAFERIHDGMVERGVDPYRVAVLELGIAQQRQRLRWLKRMIDGLEGERAPRASARRGQGKQRRAA